MFSFLNRKIKKVIVLIGVSFLVACDVTDQPPISPENVVEEVTLETVSSTDDMDAQAMLFWQVGQSHAEAFHSSVKKLSEQTAIFLSGTSDDNFQVLKQVWEEAYLSYQAALPFLFLPPDKSSVFEGLSEFRYQIGAWPIYPGYLDNVGEYVNSGLVNDLNLALTTKTLRQQHGLLSEEEVALGLHAIEYLLWGDGGNRTESVFIRQTEVPLSFAQAGLKVEEMPNNRRRHLLKLQVGLLENDAGNLLMQWQQGKLFTHYQLLQPESRLQAIHLSFTHYLDYFIDLVQAEQSENEVPPVLMNDFSAMWKQGLEQGLNTLHDVYIQQDFAKQVITPQNIPAFFERFTQSQTRIKENVDWSIILADLKALSELI